MPTRILILAGTPEAREVAGALAAWRDVETITSYAGVAARATEPPGRVRIGGFGGRQGFARYLRDAGIEIVIDALHPFAERMRRTADEICAQADIPCLRLRRPPWRPAEGDDWREFDDLGQAIAALPTGARVLLTTGRAWQDCRTRPDVRFHVRLLTAPSGSGPDGVPAHIVLHVAPPPFALADELRLFERFAITHLIAKNAGGTGGRGKLLAARARRLPVWLIRRHALETAGTAATPAELLTLLRARLPPAR